MRYGLVLMAAILPAFGQLGPAPAKPKPPRSAKEAAPVDFTGYWVSVVTEDWRWRMVTPAKGDFASIPLTAEGRKVGNAWDPAKDEAAGEQCRAYGAPALMRIPGRLHITWVDDNTLQIDADQGMQTRLLHFGGKPPQGAAASWQGYSVAQWEPPVRGLELPQQGLGATREGNRGRSLRSGYDRASARVFAEKRSALQRQHRFKGVFRSFGGTQRRSMVRGDDDCGRSPESDRAVRHQH